MNSKECSRCGVIKSLDSFPKHPQCSDGHTGRCKLCVSITKKIWWEEQGRKNQRNLLLEKTYGIDSFEWQRMFNAQKGCCLICGTHQSKLKGRLHVDHCHTTGKIRSLLCVNCNQALGSIKEDREKALRLVDYIDNYC